MVMSLTKWFFDATVPKKLSPAMPKKSASHVGSGLSIEKDLGNVLTSAATTEMDNDMKAMNLSGEQITTLALSIETGQVHTEYDTLDVSYGADPCLEEIAKQRRKAGLESLSNVSYWLAVRCRWMDHDNIGQTDS